MTKILYFIGIMKNYLINYVIFLQKFLISFCLYFSNKMYNKKKYSYNKNKNYIYKKERKNIL